MLSVKLAPEHYDFVLRAAANYGSLSEYVREKLLPAAAADLGEPIPEVAEHRPSSAPPAADTVEARLAALENVLRDLATAVKANPRHPVGRPNAQGRDVTRSGLHRVTAR